jgi:peptide/nickel transport system permease protein
VAIGSVSRHLVRRLIEGVPVLIGISLIAFTLIQLAPNDATALLIDLNSATPQEVRQVRGQYGLDQPIPVQYARMMTSLVTGDLRSIRTKERTIAMVASALPTTLVLMTWSLLLGLIVGLILGSISALRPYTRLDDAVSVLALTGISIPNFWLGLSLIVILSENLGVLPSSGIRPLGSTGANPLEGIPYWIMPVAVTGSAVAAIFARFTRASMLETLNQDYVRTARAKGLREVRVIVGHALRNCLVTVVTLIGVYIPLLLSNSVVVETVFALPGAGRLAVVAALGGDYPVVLTTSILATATVIVSNLITDIAYTFVDPRVRVH